MVCPQTTHCAILLSLLGRRESVTEYSAPQWGQKKVHPRVLVLIEARRRLLTPQTNMRPKGNKFQRRQSACAKLSPQGWPQLSGWSLQVHRALAGIVGWSRAPCKVVNRHIPVVKADAQRVTEAKAIRRQNDDPCRYVLGDFFRSGERASGSGNRERWWAISHWTRCQFMLGMDTEP